MNSNRKFLIGLIVFALIVIFIIVSIFSGEKKNNKEVINEIDYTYNILKNSGFETGNFDFWGKSFVNHTNYFLLIDDIVKYEGNYSLNLTSELDTTNLNVYQILRSYPKNKKLILNARVRTEDVDLAFLSVELYSIRDSLLTEAISDTLRGTNDWSHLTTWVRTINPELAYLKIKCNLIGKGRVWFDKLEIYPVDIPQNIFIRRP